MKSFWSGLGGIKEKAGEAINVAKKNLKEITSEPLYEEDDKPKIDQEKERLKIQCSELSEDLSTKDQEILELQKQLRILKKTTAAPDPNRLLDFRIVIGLEDSARALEIADQAHSELNTVKTRILFEQQQYAELQDSFNSLSIENQKHLQESLEKTKHIKLLEDKLQGHYDLIDEMKEQISSLQDSFVMIKRKNQGNIEGCYNNLKESCGAIGISIPHVRVENLGLEDIQEFLFTQTQFITENINKIYSSLSGKFEIKQIKSLDGVNEAVTFVVEESMRKVMEYKEISSSAEGLFQQSKKENNELSKKLVKLTKNLEEFKSISGRREEEIARLKEVTRNFEEVKIEFEKKENLLKKTSEQYLSLEKEFADERVKFEKAYSYVSTLEEEHADAKQKLKVQGMNLQEKDKILQILNREKNEISEKYSELLQKSTSELLETRVQFENKIKEIKDKHADERKNIDEAHSQSILDLQCSLGKSLNESKDLNLAKIQVTKYQQGIERLQELVKSLETELSHCSLKIDKYTQEIEVFETKILRKKQKIAELKDLNKQVSSDLQRKIDSMDAEKYNIEMKLGESEEMKKQAEMLLEKIQTKIQMDDNMIDRRLVTTFLINFLNEENTDKMKLQMLRPLVEMLGMTKEQKMKIGLEQDQGLLAQFTNFLTRG